MCLQSMKVKFCLALASLKEANAHSASQEIVQSEPLSRTTPAGLRPGVRLRVVGPS